MKNIILTLLILSGILVGATIEVPPSLYDKANKEAIRLTGCGILDITHWEETETGYIVRVVSECGKEDFVIVIEHLDE